MSRSPFRRWALLAVLAALVFALVLLCVRPMRESEAATPSTGTLSLATPVLNYTSGPFIGSNPTDQADGVPTCSPPALPCDDFTLTVDAPAGYDVSNYIKIQTSWPNQVPLAQYDIFIYRLNADNSLGPLQAANYFPVDPDV